MSVTRVGATKKYSDNWETIFGGKRRSSEKSNAGKPVRQSAKKKPAGKRPKPAKKSSRRK